MSALYRKLIEGDVSGFEGLLKKYLGESISFMDSAENFYQGFLLGLLQGMNGFERLSNREAREAGTAVAAEGEETVDAEPETLVGKGWWSNAQAGKHYILQRNPSGGNIR